jgi:hypothetical protein
LFCPIQHCLPAPAALSAPLPHSAAGCCIANRLQVLTVFQCPTLHSSCQTSLAHKHVPHCWTVALQQPLEAATVHLKLHVCLPNALYLIQCTSGIGAACVLHSVCLGADYHWRMPAACLPASRVPTSQHARQAVVRCSPVPSLCTLVYFPRVWYRYFVCVGCWLFLFFKSCALHFSLWCLAHTTGFVSQVDGYGGAALAAAAGSLCNAEPRPRPVCRPLH